MPIDYLSGSNAGDLNYQRQARTQALDRELGYDMAGYGGNLPKMQARQAQYGRDVGRLNSSLDAGAGNGELDPLFAVNASRARQQAVFDSQPYTPLPSLNQPPQTPSFADRTFAAQGGMTAQEKGMQDYVNSGRQTYAPSPVSTARTPTRATAPVAQIGSVATPNTAARQNGEPDLPPNLLNIWRNTPSYARADLLKGWQSSTDAAKSGYAANDALAQEGAARARGNGTPGPVSSWSAGRTNIPTGINSPNVESGFNFDTETPGRQNYLDYLDKTGKAAINPNPSNPARFGTSAGAYMNQNRNSPLYGTQVSWSNPGTARF